LKLPFSFGIGFLWRLAIPGCISALALWPVIALFMRWMALDVPSETTFAVASVGLGCLFVFFDMRIYMLAEGRRYWPSWLRSLMIAREERKLSRWLSRAKKHEEEAEKARAKNDQAAAIAHEGEATEYFVRAFRYPLGDGSYSISARDPAVHYPTELGNILTGYETYATQKYDLDGVFFWERLLIAAPKEMREVLDDRQALCDGALYSWYACVVGTFVYAIFAALTYFNLIELWAHDSLRISLVVAVIFLGFAIFFWSGAISLNEQFGELLKAMVDSYVDKVNLDPAIEAIEQKTGDELKKLPIFEQRRAAWRYLRWHQYRKPGENKNVDIESIRKNKS
jgi:hypothetical protein